jgi:hypothetical protein
VLPAMLGGPIAREKRAEKPRRQAVSASMPMAELLFAARCSASFWNTAAISRSSILISGVLAAAAKPVSRMACSR